MGPGSSQGSSGSGVPVSPTVLLRPPQSGNCYVSDMSMKTQQFGCTDLLSWVSLQACNESDQPLEGAKARLEELKESSYLREREITELLEAERSPVPPVPPVPLPPCLPAAFCFPLSYTRCCSALKPCANQLLTACASNYFNECILCSSLWKQMLFSQTYC